MNQKLSYFLNVILAIGLFLIVFKYGCNPEYKDKPIVINEVADSNAIYDHIDSEYSGKMIILYDSIERLNKRLKTSKTVFKTKYKEILRDSLITDSNCLITLDYANITIDQQDSIIEIQARGLDACGLQVNNLREQVLLNKTYASKLLEANILVANENEKLKTKLKRNRRIAIIITAVLGSFVLIK
jgi:hypothetical protein